MAAVQSDLEDRLRFETMLADLSSKFVNLPPAEVDREIEDAQRRVCECLELDLSALWQWSVEDPNDFRMTHLYRPLGGPPVPETMDARDYFPWCLEEILAGRSIALSNLDEAPAAAAKDCEVWRHFGIKSVLTFPLVAGGGPVFGVLSLTRARRSVAGPMRSCSGWAWSRRSSPTPSPASGRTSTLRESEERLHLAAESGEVGMWMLDVESGRFWATDRGRARSSATRPDTDDHGGASSGIGPPRRSRAGSKRHCGTRAGGRTRDRHRVQDRAARRKHQLGSSPAADAAGIGDEIRASAGRVGGCDRAQALGGGAADGPIAEVEELKRQLELENVYLKSAHRLQHGSGRIVGESPAIMEVLELVEQVAPTRSTVLIEGETGTGKELIAQRIHELSPRGDRPMVKVNCAALPSTLVESELFGREKGAYTGAVSREPGRFEVANGSTLFLDEVAELPLELQAKLLRVLEEGRFERVGSSRTLSTDVRVIAATNRDLRAEVDAGRFRRDLFFRLAVFPIQRASAAGTPRRHPAAGVVGGRGVQRRHAPIGGEHPPPGPGATAAPRLAGQRPRAAQRGRTRDDPVHRADAADRTAGRAGSEDDAVMSLDEAQRRHIARALEAAEGRIARARRCGRAPRSEADHAAFENAAPRARPAPGTRRPAVTLTIFRQRLVVHGPNPFSLSGPIFRPIKTLRSTAQLRAGWHARCKTDGSIEV